MTPLPRPRSPRLAPRAALRPTARRTAFASLASLLLALLLWLGAPVAARADAGRYLERPSHAELVAAIDDLRNAAGARPTPEQQQRLEDLGALESAIARSEDRSQIRNDSRHSVGVFTRYKREPATSPARFAVLGPGHQSDDDYEIVGLYVPAGVPLRWGQSGAAAADAPRLGRVLEGQQLRLRDAAAVAAGAEEAMGYELNLPLFSLLEAGDAGALTAVLPVLSQADLDGQPETAPTD